MKQKKIIIAIIAIAVIVVVIAIATSNNSQEESDTEEYVEVLGDGTKVNTSEKLAEAKTYNGLEITNLKFTNSSSVTNLSADVTNSTSNSIDSQLVDINVLDESGNIITSFKGTIEALEPGETTTLSAGIAANCADAYDIEFVTPE